MKFIPLPNNILILNGHKIHKQQELFDYISKRLLLNSPMTTIEQLQDYKRQYQINHIKIRHTDTFLKDESLQKRADLLVYIQKQ